MSYEEPRWYRNCSECHSEYYISHAEEERRWVYFKRVGKVSCDLCDTHFRELKEKVRLDSARADRSGGM